MLCTNKCSTINCLQSTYSGPVQGCTLFSSDFLYLVAVSTCVSHKWHRYIVNLFETSTPFLVLLRSPVKTAAYSCGNNCWLQPTNKFNQNNFYRRCSTKGTEQCNFVKCLSILIARKHQKMCCFIKTWVDYTCLLVYNSLYALL